MSNSFNINEWKEYTLYPSLFEHIAEAFPEMSFRRSGNKWISPCYLNGAKSDRKDKTFIGGAKKHLIKENGGPGMSLIDFEMQRSGCDFITALGKLASVCGLEVPKTDSEEYLQYKEEQDNRAKAKEAFVAALWSGTPEANAVLDYMRGRTWTDKEIEDAEIGYADEKIINSLKGNEPYKVKLDWGGIGTTHRLVIPFFNGSRIMGFKFRDINQKNIKYRYLNNKGLRKTAGLFGIPVGVSDVTIVEGELDALHAQVRGLSNVVATTGNAVAEEQIKEAMQRGVKRFTLLFDNDEAGREYTSSSSRIIENQGGTVYIARLPENCKDVDEFLKEHSGEELQQILSAACPVCLWRVENIYNKIGTQANEQGGITIKMREDLLRDVYAVLNDPSTPAHNRELIFNYCEQVNDQLFISREEFRALANQEYSRKNALRRQQETKAAALQIADYLKDGKEDVDKALELMAATAKEQAGKAKAVDFAKAFAPVPYSSFDKFLAETPEGLPTGFSFMRSDLELQKFTLNSGLTFVCGYRGHGKTSFLNCLALNETRRNIEANTGKSVLYFSYEVDKRKLLLDLLCAYIEKPISLSAFNTMSHYFKNTGEERYRFFSGKHFGREFVPGTKTTQRQFVDEKVESFKRDYIGSGSLVVVEENYKAEELLQAIKYYISVHPVSLVCVDYAQLLYSENSHRQRTEEVKAIVNDIKDFANKVGIPFVMAAQFNRAVTSPATVDTTNIGEAGDFERIADSCIGLFNLKELKPLPKAKDEQIETIRILEELGVKWDPGEYPKNRIKDKIFVRLLKARYGYYPLDMVVDWEGSTKCIKPNHPEDLKTQTQDNGNLFGNG